MCHSVVLCHGVCVSWYVLVGLYVMLCRGVGSNFEPERSLGGGMNAIVFS